MHPKLEILFNLLPNRCPTVFVAGGAAVDYEKATDIDLWFSKNNTVAATEFLNKQAYKEVLSEDKKYGSALSQLLGEFWHPELDKSVQVLVTQSDEVKGCLNDFDVTTHMWAINAVGQEFMSQAWTPTTVPPRVRNARAKTFSRYIKICTRYGHPVDEKVIQQILGYTGNHHVIQYITIGPSISEIEIPEGYSLKV